MRTLVLLLLLLAGCSEPSAVSGEAAGVPREEGTAQTPGVSFRDIPANRRIEFTLSGVRKLHVSDIWICDNVLRLSHSGVVEHCCKPGTCDQWPGVPFADPGGDKGGADYLKTVDPAIDFKSDDDSLGLYRRARDVEDINDVGAARREERR